MLPCRDRCVLDANSLNLQLSGQESIVPGNVLVFQSNALLVNGNAVTGNVTVQHIAAPPVPTVFLPDLNVPNCRAGQPLVVDASNSEGSLGRAWTSITWTVQQCQGAADCGALSAQAANATSDVLTLALNQAKFTTSKLPVGLGYPPLN